MKGSHLHVFACSDNPGLKLVWDPTRTDSVFMTFVDSDKFEAWLEKAKQQGLNVCVGEPSCKLTVGAAA